MSADGRVVDASTPRRVTTSEGQAYALMFALIANDPATFSTIIRWTQNNLASGNLSLALPAWQWGRADDGSWGVLDRNSASDADLWMAYALAQAGRLWGDTSYIALSRALSDRILREEVAWIPGLGATLLPAPQGFMQQQTWRLNASYVPIQVVRSMANRGGNEVWNELLKSSQRLIIAASPHGFAADWTSYRVADGFGIDQATQGVGSYDAIRVYLWAGMLADNDPLLPPLLHLLAPMADSAAQRSLPTESIDTTTLATKGDGSPGFSAALLPLLTRLKLSDASRNFRRRVDSQSLQNDQHYYSDALSLFGLGWLDGYYRFSRSGDLLPSWKAPCRAH